MFKLDPVYQLSTASVNGLDNVVTELHWIYEATVNERLYRVHGPKIDLAPPESSAFIDFASLTEAEVNSWITSNLSAAQIDFYSNYIDDHERQIVLDHEKWSAERDEWNADQQSKLDAGEIEDVAPFPDREPKPGKVLDCFCECPSTTEQAFPWA